MILNSGLLSKYVLPTCWKNCTKNLGELRNKKFKGIKTILFKKQMNFVNSLK